MSSAGWYLALYREAGEAGGSFRGKGRPGMSGGDSDLWVPDSDLWVPDEDRGSRERVVADELTEALQAPPLEVDLLWATEVRRCRQLAGWRRVSVTMGG